MPRGNTPDSIKKLIVTLIRAQPLIILPRGYPSQTMPTTRQFASSLRVRNRVFDRSLNRPNVISNHVFLNLSTFVTASLRAARQQPVACLLLVMTALKVVAIYVYVPPSATLLDVGFGFAPYVQSLITNGHFAACDYSACDYARRMPGVPYFLFILSFFTDGLRTAALIKAIALSGLLWLSYKNVAAYFLVHSVMLRRVLFSLVAFLALSPNLVKHAAMVDYEEGYVLELLAAATTSTMFLVASNFKTSSALRYAAPIIAVSIAYLFKSSMVVIWVVTSSLVVCLALTAARLKLASGLIALALAAPSGWLLHNWTQGGKATIMSSYDGENAFRGWNVHTLDLYPDCTLDLLFQPISICGLRTMQFPAEPRRADFATEWEWNDRYAQRARDWVINHQSEALKILGVKLYTVFLSVRIVPHYRVTDGANDTIRTRVEEWLSGLWLSLGRALEIVWLAVIGFLICFGDTRARRLAFTSLVIPLGYALPYVVGFGYERHFSLLIMLVTIGLIFSLPEAARLRSTKK